MAKKDRILITGGTGFIGSHLVQRLVGLGQQVDSVSLGSYFSGISTGLGLPGVVYHTADLSDRDACDRIISRLEPDYVFHLAAQPLVETALRSPMDTFETNIRGAFNLLQALHYYGAAKGVVWVSTDKVYGSYKTEVRETDPLLGFGHPYDVSKMCADVLAQTFAICYKLPVVITRSGNIYGPGDPNNDRLIPETIRSTLAGDPVQVRSNGKFVRDYIYVDDIVDAFLYALSGLSSKKLKYGEVVNFGSERAYSVAEIIDTVLEITNRVDLVPQILNTEKHEIPYQHLNFDKARDLLGWTPKTSLVEGLKKTLDCYKQEMR